MGVWAGELEGWSHHPLSFILREGAAGETGAGGAVRAEDRAEPGCEVWNIISTRSKHLEATGATNVSVVAI